jgi:hypothetical protein
MPLVTERLAVVTLFETVIAVKLPSEVIAADRFPDTVRFPLTVKLVVVKVVILAEPVTVNPPPIATPPVVVRSAPYIPPVTEIFPPFIPPVTVSEPPTAAPLVTERLAVVILFETVMAVKLPSVVMRRLPAEREPVSSTGN